MDLEIRFVAFLATVRSAAISSVTISMIAALISPVTFFTILRLRSGIISLQREVFVHAYVHGHWEMAKMSSLKSANQNQQARQSLPPHLTTPLLFCPMPIGQLRISSASGLLSAAFHRKVPSVPSLDLSTFDAGLFCFFFTCFLFKHKQLCCWYTLKDWIITVCLRHIILVLNH
jgi:hypothetical protein